MFFLIFGWGPRFTDLGSGGYHDCPRCRNHVMRRRVERTNWINLFFLPVIPTSRKQMLVCPICGHEEPAT
jgi:hypothetical protein